MHTATGSEPERRRCEEELRMHTECRAEFVAASTAFGLLHTRFPVRSDFMSLSILLCVTWECGLHEAVLRVGP